MKIMYAPRPEEVERMNTDELRGAFLTDRLFEAGEIRLVCSNLDRMIVGGAMPASGNRLSLQEEFGTCHLTRGRELGIINIGDPGIVFLNGREYQLGRLDGLYVGMSEEHVSFGSLDGGRPAFYILSCPAHVRYPSAKIPADEVRAVEIGDKLRCSGRRLRKYICAGGLSSCQLVMGLTEVEEGSVWNTLPPHTHNRRSEIYLYFDLGDQIVVHLMGNPERTRHLVVHDRQGVLSPCWSIHAGVGTGSYRFVWGMAGENRDFQDIDPVELSDLK